MDDAGPIRDDAGSAPSEAEEAARVEAWLRARPRFLAERPGLYLALEPPRRVHGEGLADHMAAMIEAQRRRADAATEFARASLDFGARAQRAVLALIGAPDPCEAIAEDWPALLGLDAAHVACEGPPARHRRRIPPGTAARLMPVGRDSVVRDEPDPDPDLHGESAALVARDALLRLPGPRLVVLACRDPRLLPARGVAPHLLFLSRAAAQALAA